MEFISITKAAEILKQGGVVAIPTETVYGLAGNALNETAVAKIFAAKERPFFDPLIVHITEFGMLDNLVTEIPKNARLLAEKFWAGPLTMVLPKKGNVPNLTTGGLSTVAVRMPKNQTTIDIINAAGFPLAAPSANKFQHLSPTSAEHVLEQLGDKIDGIVDGGSCEIGVESTIIGFENEIPIVYRPGAITIEMINDCIGIKTQKYKKETVENIVLPGMLKKHYCPNTLLCLNIPKEIPQNSGLLAFGELPENAKAFKEVLNLSETKNLTEAAANLYGMLHKLDSYGLTKIYTTLLPNKGIGIAINDRLTKAAAS